MRVLQEHKILAVGDTQERDVDVRIIAATNKNLREMIVEGNFREDLYYRLAESELILPSLSAYDADSINIMIDSFINKFSTENRTTIKLSKNVRHFLLNYKYPGNIRELEAIIKYLYVHAVDIIEMTHLPARLQINPATDKLIDIKRSHCQKVFEKYGRNYTQAANALGIQINTLKGHLRCDL